MEILIILLLIIINGVFAMAEIAIISAKKHRLQQRANEGNKKAQTAIELANNPSRFLSTVQIGMTLIGILTGAFGGATIAKQLSLYLQTIHFLAPYSEALSIALVVLIITYLSLIIGEIVPKRIALNAPEGIAIFVARPLRFLSTITLPLVILLTKSTDWVLSLLQIKPRQESQINEEDIRTLIREGTKIGIFELTEKDIVERTFAAGNRRINSLMTARKEIVWLDIDSSHKTIRSKITKHPHPQYPVCRDTLDKVIGIVRTENLLTDFLAEEKIEILKSLHKPLFVPETMEVLKVLELFKKSGIHLALVVDEYGNIQGLISLTDILEEIVGDIPTVNEMEEKEIIKRDKNSWLINGLIAIDEFKEHFSLKKLSGEKSGAYHTLGGFVVYKLGRIPVTGDIFEWDGFKFEIVDMDGNRVDKILLVKKK